ncbi:formyl transferase [Crenothrix polyspora]|uniref:phosphoribosylglycinamide formyltransferase 1 n=1 Tax=Crenothrix polyspora TaxID=360316 RepID=A0A1R4HCW0_9GAMM|nr:formyl transferase [Crenothrix polyspora]SJM94063.1 Formyltransferase domain protein [Crenothrix polyspora]
MNTKKIRVVMLCGNRQSSRIMYNGLASHVDIVNIIVEDKPSAKIMIQRRMAKLGAAKTVGQLFFLVVNRLLEKLSTGRITQLISAYGLNEDNFPTATTIRVATVNSAEVIALLKEIQPDAVVVNGTRIIANNVLTCIAAPFINTHNGITPKYRGTHGGYWALANSDADNCGVTLHLVDPGIDTGGVLYQATIQVNKQDNLNTYPIHQIAKAIPLMIATLDDIKENRLTIKQGVFPSQLWHHPTLLEYIQNWRHKGVK